VSARLEFEVEISDLTTGRHIFEVLGYEVITIYEKFRASYSLDNVELSLDEMPFGEFMEIEGGDAQQIRQMSDKLKFKVGKPLISKLFGYLLTSQRTAGVIYAGSHL